ncbi:MAG: hypothetical protein RL701_2156 [Pseudomonadota bacterium]
MVLAIALTVPTVFTGFALDDYVLLSRMSEPSHAAWAGSAPFDLFRWLDPAHNQQLIDGKGMPWWTFEGARCAFFRPLASLTHALDHALFARDARLMHIHSLLWFGLLLWLAAKAYGELIAERWVAALAAAMFALDSAHGVALCWISNRNALMAGALGIATLICHQRSRRTGSLGYACAAWVYFALALLSGELAVGLAGYVVAYTCTMDQTSTPRRLLALAPYALLLGAWAVARHAGGYGSYGLGAYVDPIAEPIDFVRTLPQRWTQLMASQIGSLAADLYGLAPRAVAPLLNVCAGFITVIGVWFVTPVLKSSALARYFALGAALSTVPLAATIPADRLLVLVGFGIIPLLALAIQDALQAARSDQAPEHIQAVTARRRAAIAFTGLHLAVAAILLPLTALSTALVARWSETAEASVPVTPQVLFVASVPDSVLLTYVPMMREWTGTPQPEKLYWLHAMPGSLRVERRQANRLRITANQGMFDRRSEARSAHFAFHPGDKVVLSEMTIDVLELNHDGLPSVCEFTFQSALESARYQWQTWEAGKLQSFALPKVGESRWLSTS